MFMLAFGLAVAASHVVYVIKDPVHNVWMCRSPELEACAWVQDLPAGTLPIAVVDMSPDAPEIVRCGRFRGGGVLCSAHQTKVSLPGK